MSSNTTSKPYDSFDDSKPQNMIIYRMQLQAHNYVLIKQSILYLLNLYNTVTEELCTLTNKPKKVDAAFTAFGSDPITAIDYLLSPMAEDYWGQKKEVSVATLQETERKGNEFLSELRGREAMIRVDVLKQKVLMNKALEEKGEREKGGENPQNGGGAKYEDVD